MTTRLFFIGPGRIADAVLSLQFDYKLDTVLDKTIIYHLQPIEEIIAAFEKFKIDVNKFVFVHDDILVDEFYSKTNYNLLKLKGPPWSYHSWIWQQLLKLIAVDLCEDDQIVISDCDVIQLRSHRYFDNDKPVLLVSDDNKDPVWDSIVTQLLGKTTVGRTFVSECFPILKTQWRELTSYIETQHQCQWIDAIAKNILDNDRNFSEYQLLGNWLLQYDVTLVEKYTYALHDHNNIDTILKNDLTSRINYNHFLTTGIQFDQVEKVKTIINQTYG
jgi:hypothetical protein